MPALVRWAAMREPMVPAPRTAARLIKNGWVDGETLMKPSILMCKDADESGKFQETKPNEE